MTSINRKLTNTLPEGSLIHQPEYDDEYCMKGFLMGKRKKNTDPINRKYESVSQLISVKDLDFGPAEAGLTSLFHSMSS